MGLLLAAGASVSSILGDQWKEYFYCPAMDNDVLVRKGQPHHGKSGILNRGGSDNIITSGSTIVVNDGQCMCIVDNGVIVEVAAEPGAYTYDASKSPSIFAGGLAAGIVDSFKEALDRFAHGGITAKDQRIYYFNIKNIMGNKYGTAAPVPYRVVDPNAGIDIDIAIKCFGEYSYRLADPILFYKNICGNIQKDFTRDRIESQLRSELLTALQPAFARISEMGIRYSALPGHTSEMAEALNAELDGKWGKVYGIEIVTFGVNSVKASEEDERMIKELQRTAAFKNPGMAGAQMVSSTAQAMQDAAKNPGGAMIGFAGMGMAQQAGGINAADLFAMGQAQSAPAMKPASAAGWTCPKCGTAGNTGKFCGECGTARPAEPETWTCPKCGQTGNTGKFCGECGTPRPAADAAWTCPDCGQTGNTGKFCSGCGRPRG